MTFYTRLHPNTLNTRSILILAIALLFLSGCASTPVNDQEITAEEINIDPYEDFNRSMHGFNDSVDDYVMGPITNAYKFVTPDLFQIGVSNFFTNLGNVTVVLNDVLQGKAQQGAEDTGRFLINSTIGVFGLFDVASELGLEQNQEDFGQTLAVWGVPTGAYLVMPFLGPTTFRGLPATAVDLATNPVTYVGLPAVQAAALVNTRASADGALKFIDDVALDPYIYTREAYLQWRNHLATDGDPDAEADPFADFEDELFEDEDLYEVEVKLDQNVDNNEQDVTQLQDNTELAEDFLELKPAEIVENTDSIDIETIE